MIISTQSLEITQGQGNIKNLEVQLRILKTNLVDVSELKEKLKEVVE